MTEEEIRKVVRLTVKEIFIELGVNVNNPLSAQADFAYLHKLRKGSEGFKIATKQTIIKTSLGAVVFGFLYILWKAIYPLIHKGM